MIIALDFDGTVVAHEYPAVGRDIGAVPWIKRLQELGAKIILHTVRDGRELEDAVAWFQGHGIPLWGVNENPDQETWSTSRKVHANVFVDDLALGCPLKGGEILPERPYVDWDLVGPQLINMVAPSLAVGARYKKRAVVIEAFQMTKERRQDNSEWPCWLSQAWQLDGDQEGAVGPVDFPNSDGTDKLFINTIEGRMNVEWGDYIIRGIKGELYPCKPDIFEMTYDPVL